VGVLPAQRYGKDRRRAAAAGRDAEELGYMRQNVEDRVAVMPPVFLSLMLHLVLEV
jgi:hypothetical protein